MQRMMVAVLLLALAATASAQERFSPFVASDMEEVRRMLAAAALRDGDVVLDLGSGDGRIALEAARMNPRVRGRGVDIDEALVRQSNAAAQSEGLADRVHFLHQDAFDADLKEASVITMWLFPELMRLLRPKILAEATPGTRVVTRTWDLGSWKPDATEKGLSNVYVWTVPAKVAGYWTWELPLGGVNHSYSAVVEQHFQSVEGVVRSGNRRGLLENMVLKGQDISFSLTMTVGDKSPVNHTFTGRVLGDTMQGSVSVQYSPNPKPYVLPWRAVRSPSTTYFAPTGRGAQ